MFFHKSWAVKFWSRVLLSNAKVSSEQRLSEATIWCPTLSGWFVRKLFEQPHDPEYHKC